MFVFERVVVTRNETKNALETGRLKMCFLCVFSIAEKSDSTEKTNFNP